MGLTQYLSDQMTLDGAAFYERRCFEDDFGTRDFSLAGLTGGLICDTRDDATDATEGFYVNVTAEPFYEFYYGNAAFRTTAEVRAYFGFARRRSRFVLAGRVKVGRAGRAGPRRDPARPAVLCRRRRFGARLCLQGHRRRWAAAIPSPVAAICSKARSRRASKVTNDIGVVGFVDGGYVAADTFPGLDELRIGAGVGVRYYTGLGPLRLDVAFPLNKRPGDPDYALYVGIGQAF